MNRFPREGMACKRSQQGYRGECPELTAKLLESAKNGEIMRISVASFRCLEDI